LLSQDGTVQHTVENGAEKKNVKFSKTQDWFCAVIAFLKKVGVI